MGDTIEVILNYLRKNHFTKAEAAFEEEVNSRQNVESGLSPVRDGLDDKLVQHLSSFQQTALPLDFDPLTISIQRALNTSGHQIDEVPQKQVLENPAMNNRGIIACPTRCQSETLQEKCLFGTSQDQYLKLQNFAAGTEEAPVQWVNKDTLLKDSVNTNAMQDLIQPEENKGVTEEDKNVQSCMEHLLHKEDEKLGMQLFLERELTEARNDAEQCQSYETKVEEKEVMHSKRLQNQIKGACLAATIAGNRKKESSHVGTSDEDYAQSGLSSNVALRATWKDSSELGFSNPLLKPAVYDEETPVSGQTAHKNDVTDVTLVDLFQHEKVPIQKAFPVHEMNKCFQEEIGNGENEESVHANNSLEPSTEVLPRLPPVKLHSLDKHLDSSREGSGAGNSTRSFESAFRSLGSTPEGPFGLSSFFELPLGHDFSSSGAKQISTRPSVSQGIVENCLPGFAMPGDELSESREYVDDYWDSDGYEDEDDPGYLRQPIEDEAWFLAHEIDYPSEDERARNGAGKSQNSYNELRKFEEDEHSFVEEESYFSGEEYYKSKHDRLTDNNRRDQVRYDHDFDDILEKSDTSVLKGPETSGYNRDLMNCEQINFLCPDLSWNGFVSQNKHDNDHGGRVYSDSEIPEATCSLVVNADSDNAERSGVGVKYNVPQLGSGSRDYFVPGSSERDIGIFISDQELALCGSATTRFCQSHSPQERLGRVESRHVEVRNAPVRHLDDDEDDDHDRILQFFNESWGHKKHNVGREVPNMAAFKHTIVENENRIGRIDGQQDSMVKAEQDNGGFGFGGFSFPSHSSAGDVIGSKSASRKSLLSTRDSTGQSEEGDKHFNSMNGPDDTLAAWKRKSNESSPIFSSRDEHLLALNLSNQSAASVHSTGDYVSIEAREGTEGHETGQTESIDVAVADDEDTTTINEQIRKSGVEEDEFEVFDLRIVHRKNRTGFEEEKDFPVVISSLIAGRYHVTEYLGSAAFSKAIQAHDLYTGIDVCMKVIKNNKDFFDQSLDEIKLLKFVNKHDPADKYHVLRLYDYFYHREHLFIVCELLRANLYEFQKFNKESGGEVYFTMPRLQLIARQCLEALEFLHGLGLIHCDLKPENILVKSYSRCEIKVIDLGSSCFQTDHLCSYVQSRSYRAPEVILGLPYDQKIDIWSLGCILAELCSGNVLFQNDSLATLLARVIGILGPIDPEMLAKGRDTYRFFTKNHMLYERNQETGQLEYLLPKKTSLSYRLPMGDQGFIEFVRYLLQINVANRPTAREALQHPWLLYPYEPVSS